MVGHRPINRNPQNHELAASSIIFAVPIAATARDSSVEQISQTHGGPMVSLALYAHLKAKPGKVGELEAFLKSALPLAEKEAGTITWYAFQEDEGSYGIFDTFDTEAARQAHLDGPIAKALIAKASELLAEPPAIHKIRLLAAKVRK
jgi:quinol monooxygenase YgiN